MSENKVPTAREWARKAGVKVGDKVRVLANTEDWPEGPPVGEVFVVQGFSVSIPEGVYLDVATPGDNQFWFEFWLLSKVPDDARVSTFVAT